MIYKGADVVVFSSSPKSTLPLWVSAETQRRRTEKHSLAQHAHTHISVGKNSEFANVLSVYECEFELNWRHPIGTGTEMKGRGIY